MFDPAFTLIGRGLELTLDDIPARGGVIDVGQAGVAGVVGALKAGQGWIARDTSVAAGDGPGFHLQTSGTTGAPKWVTHTLDTLTARIRPGTEKARWLLTYHPGSFAGVQVILSAMIGGHELIAPDPGDTAGSMALMGAVFDVTHMSGTPTFWRSALLVLGTRTFGLKSITLGGEMADQALLDALRAKFPEAVLRHIYATTEAGTVFSVGDGRAGFPAAWLNETLSVSDRGTLVVGGVDTGDVVEVVEDRVLFRGRADSMVNVGGVKVFPETVEAHLLACPQVQEVRVTAKSSPITGAILVADIVLNPRLSNHEPEIRAHIAQLPRAQRPASLRFVDAIETGATGKKVRT